MGEPIDLYLGFDEGFFDDEAEDATGRYRALLEEHRVTLNAVLNNEHGPEALGKDFYRRLDELIGPEKRHS